MEFMVLARLDSGVGREISGGESAATSANVSKNVESLKATWGGVLGCFSVGCAQLGICISTCRGAARSGAAEGLREDRVESDLLGELLSVEYQVEKEPLLESSTGLWRPADE